MLRPKRSSLDRAAGNGNVERSSKRRVCGERRAWAWRGAFDVCFVVMTGRSRLTSRFRRQVFPRSKQETACSPLIIRQHLQTGQRFPWR